MPQIKSIRNNLEQIMGGSFFITALFFSYRNTRSVTRAIVNYKGYSRILSKSSIDLSPLITNPNRQQNVVIPNLTCKPTKTLFAEHVKYIDNATAEYNGPSYCQRCDNFIAETQYHNQKYAIHCNISNEVFVSSSLLCNLILLQKSNSLNDKLTMYSYGSMSYNKKNNQFQFQPECFTTNRQEIDEVWSQILKRRGYLYLIYGILLGFGLCLLKNQEQNIRIECQQLKNYIDTIKKEETKLN